MIPEHIIKIVENSLGEYPSIIETHFYDRKFTMDIISKHQILWANQEFDGKRIIIKDGLVKFKDSNIYLYIKITGSNDEYSFWFLSKMESKDSILMYLNNIKTLTKFKIEV